MKREEFIPSTDKKNRLHVIIWEPETVKAIMQISHGMVEYVDRFDVFAKELNKRGILVIGNDHLGHGLTASVDEDLGYIGAEMSKTVVDDLHAVTLFAKNRYENVPVFLFGHSMGSFMARRYLMTYAEELKGAIISGTGFTPNPVLTVAGIISAWLKLIHGERYRSQFLKNLSFSGYLKRIQNPRTANDWLTKDEKIVDRYNADKYCTYTFTVNGYQTLFGVLRYIQDNKNVEKIPENMPIFMISGKEDPVGAYGEGVKKVYHSYKNVGIKDIAIKLYENDRHELTNETDKEVVFKDVIEWIENHLSS